MGRGQVENQDNLFRYAFADRTITEVTDLLGRGRPGGVRGHGPQRRVLADGRRAPRLTAFGERPARSGPPRITHASFRETFRARPRAVVVRVDTRSGAFEVPHEERAWIGHASASPTRPDVRTFCHEEPRDGVDLPELA